MITVLVEHKPYVPQTLLLSSTRGREGGGRAEAEAHRGDGGPGESRGACVALLQVEVRHVRRPLQKRAVGVDGHLTLLRAAPYPTHPHTHTHIHPHTS